MKTIKRILLLLLLFLTAAGLLIVHWTHTPHGKLDARVAILLKFVELNGIDLFEKGRSVDEARAIAARGNSLLKGKPVHIKRIEEREIPGKKGPIPIRLYTDLSAQHLPVVLYFHGGGWVLGGLDSHDQICRIIAKKARTMVIAVDYRLAPESPFPAATDDVYSALVWVRENAEKLGGDPENIILAGDSAGGNLAAVTAIRARELGAPALAGQILIYPAINLSALDTVSHKAFASGYYLTRVYMEHFRQLYLPDPSHWKTPMASPLLEPDLRGLPKTLIITAQFDILRDEAQDYARNLKQAGVQADLVQVNGVIHGFLGMDRILPQAEDIFIRIAEFIDGSEQP